MSEITEKSIGAEWEHRAKDIFSIFTIPDTEKYATLGADLRSLDISRVMGNSANLGRRMFGVELAVRAKVDYIHLSKGGMVDELTKEKYLEQVPNGLDTLMGIIQYQSLTAMTKFFRYYGVDEEDRISMNLPTEKDAHSSLLLVGDAVSVFVNGDMIEKPKDHLEAMDQMNRFVTGEPYYLSNVQMAIWASGVRGVATNVHLLPVRISPRLDRWQKMELRNTMNNLYQSGKVPVTPGAVSFSNPEVLPFVEVGMLQDPEHYLGSTSAPPDVMQKKPIWMPVTDGQLPPSIRDEICTTLMGCSPRGYADVVTRLINDTIDTHARFAASTRRRLSYAGMMINAPHQVEYLTTY